MRYSCTSNHLATSWALVLGTMFMYSYTHQRDTRFSEVRSSSDHITDAIAFLSRINSYGSAHSSSGVEVNSKLVLLADSATNTVLSLCSIPESTLSSIAFSTHSYKFISGTPWR